MKTFEELGQKIGKLTDEKNIAYGDAFMKPEDFLKILFPNGVPIDKYKDMLCIIRIFDKQMRIATMKEAFDENMYKDIVGYGLLGHGRK